MDYNVFISYSSKQKTIADCIKHYLEEYRISCWMAPDSIPPSSSYPEEINKAIAGCKICLLVYSNTASLSPWVKKEVNQAINMGKTVLPFRIEETKYSDFFDFILSDTHWIEAYPHYADMLPPLLKAICAILGIEPPLTRLTESYKTEKGPDCVPIKMIYVEGGTFEMGATIEQGKDAYDSEKPKHKVSLSSFEISESPITVVQYQEYCKATGAKMPAAPSWGWINNHPIVNVSWFDAYNFAKWKGCRLPTEAEWEFAARGGILSKHYKYSGGNTPNEIGWFADNTGQTGTRPVRAKRPNELGLYDMSGNVYEWCNDWKYEFTPEDQINPTGPDKGIIKASKGGSWHSSSRSLRVSNRDDDPPEFYSHNVGFRIARDIDQEQKRIERVI